MFLTSRYSDSPRSVWVMADKEKPVNPSEVFDDFSHDILTKIESMDAIKSSLF